MSITASKCEKFDKSWVSEASCRKWAWVLKVFEEWKKQKNEAVLKQDYSGELVIQQDIDKMSDEMLDFTLARFVAEVTKKGGQEYPGKNSCTFRNLNSALNLIMEERARQGIGVDVNQANLITQEQENYLWEHGFLGSENAELLCHTLVWVLGIQFALRAGQEYRNLRPENSQLSLQCDELGREFLQCTEDISKTNNGGLSHLRIKRKVVRAYKNLTNVERCPVELYKKYLSHMPNEVSGNAFYLRALPKPNGEIWYYKKAAGRETLGNVVKKIMKKVQFD